MIDLTDQDDKQKARTIVRYHGTLKNERKRGHDPLRENIGKIFTPRSYKLLKDNDDDLCGATVYTEKPADAMNKFVRGSVGYLVSTRPWWLGFTPSNQALLKDDDVKDYLQKAEEQVRFGFNQSKNFIGAMSHIIEDGVTIGPGTVVPEYDITNDRVVFKNKSHWRVWIDDDEWGNADVYHEEVEFTAHAALAKFKDSEDKLPGELIKDATGVGSRSPFTKYKFIYAVYKNPDFDRDSVNPMKLPYIGRYVCITGNMRQSQVLIEEKGREWFPIILRMNRKDSLVYNTNRTLAAEALTSALMDHKLGEHAITASHLAVKPRIWAPLSLKGKIERDPDGITYYNDKRKQEQEVKALLDRLDWPITDAQRERLGISIEDKFFVRFFELLSAGDMPQITAFQASQMAGEKAVLLGPIVKPIEDDVLEAASEVVWSVEESNGRMPPVPDVLLESVQNRKILNEFKGPITQLTRSLLQSKGTLSWLQIANAFLSLFPDAARKIKNLEAFEEMSIEQGAKQSWFKSDEQIEAEDQAALEREAQLQAAELGIDAAKTVPGLGKAVEQGSPLEVLAGAV